MQCNNVVLVKNITSFMPQSVTTVIFFTLKQHKLSTNLVQNHDHLNTDFQPLVIISVLYCFEKQHNSVCVTLLAGQCHEELVVLLGGFAEENKPGPLRDVHLPGESVLQHLQESVSVFHTKLVLKTHTITLKYINKKPKTRLDNDKDLIKISEGFDEQ